MTKESGEGRGERLYNGIELPSEWPPNYGSWTGDPMPVPYLKNSPDVIPMDVGRQLLVDDFLVESTDLVRVLHFPKYYEGNPIIVPHRPWEAVGEQPMAMPFSDGVWWDPQDQQFKLWYLAGSSEKETRCTCYVTSEDGIRWTKPVLDIVAGTNIVQKAERDSTTVWLDDREQNPQKRFKFSRRFKGKLALHHSPDGIHWSDIAAWSGDLGDRSTFFYNPFRNVWVCSAKGSGRWPDGSGFRMRLYKEAPDWVAACQWQREQRALAAGQWAPGEPVVWVSADKLDPRHPWPKYANAPRQLYNLDAAPYESLMIGLFSIWQGPENPELVRVGIHKQNQVFVGFSRDGFHWDRPHRYPFLPTDIDNENAWNRGNVQSAGGCLVMGDKLYFYCSGRAYGKPRAACTTGLGILRRDGFASMEIGAVGGTLTTRPVMFRGKYLFVNADVDGGELRAEVLDKDGRVIPGFAQEQCLPVSTDRTAQQVVWQGGKDLAGLAGQPVRFRFHLCSGGLYAFWVSPEKNGASHGYVAGGGLGFTGATDTVGSGR